MASGISKLGLGVSGCGTAADDTVVAEYGDGYSHTSVITMSKVDAFTYADNAAISGGMLAYTFPAGEIVIEGASITVAATAADSTLAADDPEFGLGTDVATGAYGLLSAVDTGETITTENILTGTASTNGTLAITVDVVQVALATAADHTVYLNFADTFADTAGTDLTADLEATVVLKWYTV